MYEIEVPKGAPKVDILVFSYRQAPVNPLLSIFTMWSHSRIKGIDARLGWYGSALIEHSRNNAISKVRKDADYVLLCDDDMMCYPHALDWLMKLDKPIVAPLFTTRSEPVNYTLKTWNPKTETFIGCPTLKEGHENKVLDGQFALGMAFTLIRRDALDQVIEYHVTAQDWAAEHRKMFDRLHVRSEYREAERKRIEGIRRARLAADGMVHIFDRERLDNDDRLGEDITFFRKVLACGITTSVDTRENNYVGHQGEYVYGPWDMGTVDNLQDYMDETRRKYEVA